MNVKDLREAMGLTTAQVAEELGVPRQDVADSEETGSTWLMQPFIAAFPINPAIMTNENIDPFLDSYVQNEMKDRAAEWREENGVSLDRMAAAVGMTGEQLRATEESGRITRALGIKLEKTVGINRKWLMYGDGRKKGQCILPPEKTDRRKNQRAEGENGETGTSRTPPNRAGGQRLKEARKAAGYSREAVAEKLGLSVSRIAQMENGYIRDEKADEIIRMMQPEVSGKELGQRVRDARKAAGLKLREAGELLGLAGGTLAAMECGHLSENRAKELIEKLQNASKKQEEDGGYSREAGIRIREARKAVGMSQKELGVILRQPESAVARMELGAVTARRAEEVIRRIQGAPRYVSSGPRKVRKTVKVLLGRQVREAREAAGLSQKAVGELTGYPQSRISLMEKGQIDDAEGEKILRAIEEEVSRRVNAAEG